MKKMNRETLIAKYEKMMYKFGEFDIWDDDILPKLPTMTTEEIKHIYLEDKEYYTERERKQAEGYWV